MTEPTFGITITRDDNEARPVVASDMSVVGIVGTAPDADADVFPLNERVLVYSSDATQLAKLGATGTIIDAIKLLNAQLADNQVAAKVVVERIEAGSTVQETIGNIIGSEAEQTGLFGLLQAGPELGAIPRLIMVPGYTHQRFGGIDHVTGLVGGTGFTSAPTPVFTGGSPIRPAVATATISNGAVTGLNFSDKGLYLTPPTISFSGGGGSGASVTAVLEQTANPVCAALAGILPKLLGVAVVEGPGTNATDIKNWRETLQSERLIPVDTWCKVWSGTDQVTKPGAPGIIGIGVRRDYEFRGVPSHSWANQPFQGIVGPARFVNFSLTDGATEGQDLLSNNIGVLLRGELGVETAIASSGFVFVGTDNAADDPIWQSYSRIRLRDYIHLGLLRTERFYLGKFNITRQAIQAVLNTAAFWLRDLRADEHILGYHVGFEPDKNSPENLRLGRFRYFFEAEEAPVLKRIDIDSRPYRVALEHLVEDLIKQTNDLVG